MNKKKTKTSTNKPDYKEYLKKIYFNPKHPAAFSGVEQLYKIVKSEEKFNIGRYRIKKRLQNQKEFSLQKQVPTNFKRQRVISADVNNIWDADLLDVSNISSYNSGIRFFLMCIDIFSRKLYLKTLKNKQSSTVVDGFKKIFKHVKPEILRTDSGSEFNNRVLIKYLDSLNYHTPNSITKENSFKFWHTQYIPPLKPKKHISIKMDHVIYVTSNDSKEYFPENNTVEFKSLLDSRFVLSDSQWYVALTEVIIDSISADGVIDICTNIIRFSHLANKKLPILRRIHVKQNTVVNLKFSQPLYLPVVLKTWDTIKVNIFDSKGNIPTFIKGTEIPVFHISFIMQRELYIPNTNTWIKYFDTVPASRKNNRYQKGGNKSNISTINP
ncbi:hypothetical protein KUTeg_010496 [Tegillarca granosa]|uniref:Integrase catalytic domain-containing protein n=1 Tax=Tegillarca granosa TaxID=220873 RepID=A0ABQ9F3G8_TEGGR|nr:hypothetical protein KUTeg_010496 [Tegillarca granosa]